MVEFASAAFRSLGYLVDGSGNLTGQSLRLANWTLSPTASGLSIDSSAQRTTALAIQAGGSGWAVGDKFTFGARGVGKVTAISAAAATAVAMLVPDVQTTPPANPVATVATNVSDGHAGGSGLTLNLTWTAATAALSLQPSGGAIGFYGATPVAKQTGVAITVAAVHAALTALGLIAP
jgi:hypothetical protein